MFKSVEDFQNLAKGQIEATTAAAAAVSRGLQQIAGETSAYAKRSVEDGSAATTRLMGANSFEDAVAVQSAYAKAALAGFAAQASRMGSLMISVGKDVAKPFEAVMPSDLGAGPGKR